MNGKDMIDGNKEKSITFIRSTLSLLNDPSYGRFSHGLTEPSGTRDVSVKESSRKCVSYTPVMFRD